MRNSAAYLVSGPVGYEDFLTKTWADCGLKNFPGMCMVDIGVIQHLHPAMFVVPQLASSPEGIAQIPFWWPIAALL